MRRVLAATTRFERAVYVLAVVGYVALSFLLWGGKDFSKEGPLAWDRPAATDGQLVELGTSRDRVESDCFAEDVRIGDGVKIVTAVVSLDRRLFACYDYDEPDQIQYVYVVNDDGEPVSDPKLLKESGVWPHYAVIKSAEEFVVGGVGLLVLLPFAFWALSRPRVRPAEDDAPWWGRDVPLFLLAATGVGLIYVPMLRGVPRERKGRFFMWGVIGWAAVIGLAVYADAAAKQDTWGVAVLGYMAVALFVSGVVGGLARKRFRPAALAKARRPEPEPQPQPQPQPVAPATAQPVASSGASPSEGADSLVRVQPPEKLPDFSSVGGMTALKQELKETLGLTLAFSEHADAYRISWNGILLHGRPGTGKTFLAQATAGEFGLSFLHVATGDLVSAYRGESARNVEAVFKLALRNIPALLFFDEFDSVASRRDDNPDQEARRTVNQLLQSLEETRTTRELVVMAATNDVGALDTAVIRPGRFDRHVHVPLPDRAARRSILTSQLRGRPGADDVDGDDLAARTEGLTPAALAQLVTAASLEALRESTASADNERVPLTTERLVAALKARGGQDRPTVEEWTWDRLVLPPSVKSELKEIAALAEDPERGARFGIAPPSGVLLFGPPGTGKTTVARVLAAEARCSFYPVSGADLTSKWLGESERLISQLFERARDNRPSIVFIDEIDAIAAQRGQFGSYDRQVNQLLQEIDGVESTAGVVVIGATNRRELLDAALLRGGRLSRHIEIPLPDVAGRRQLLGLFTAKMPLAGVDLDSLAEQAEGLSGADLQALCQEAAMQAMIRSAESVEAADFAAALAARAAAGAGDGAAPRRPRAKRGDDQGYI